jgi:hypothetical protein
MGANRKSNRMPDATAVTCLLFFADYAFALVLLRFRIVRPSFDETLHDETLHWEDRHHQRMEATPMGTRRMGIMSSSTLGVAGERSPRKLARYGNPVPDFESLRDVRAVDSAVSAYILPEIRGGNILAGPAT